MKNIEPEERNTPEPTNTCKECGTTIPSDSQFCQSCAARQRDVEQKQMGSSQPEVCPPREVHNATWIGIGGGLLIVFGLLELLAGFVLGSLFDLILGGAMVAVGVVLLVQAFRSHRQVPSY